MQLRATRLTAIASAVKRAISAFNVRSLFASGAQGVWYDPSDMSTLFQDSAGTVPVTAVEQPVGLMLDKSQGLVLGSELVTNGSFTTDTDWTKSAGVTITGGKLVFAASSNGFAYQAQTLSATSTYVATVSVDSISAGSIQIRLGSSTNVSSANITVAGTYTFYLFGRAGMENFIQLIGSSSSTTATVDNFSIKIIAGNHAFQATSASRPVLSARYNLLTKTEDFNSVVWTKVAASVTADSTTAPNGTLTADTLIENSGGGEHFTFQQIAKTATSTTYTKTAYFKNAVGTRNFALGITDGTTGGYGAIFSTAGAVVSASFAIGTTTGWTFVASSVNPVGDGWYQASLTVTSNTSTRLDGVCYLVSGTTTIYTGNGTSGVFLWGADLKPANQSTLPYQRVNTATDYTTTGFLPYLKFDGVDDSLSTNSISFTATDKMSVFAGVRKLSDAARGILAELSPDALTNNGSFLLGAPYNTGSNEFKFYCGGTTRTGVDYLSPGTPTTRVITGLNNIATPVVTIRADGVQAATSSSSQGTGNYGNYPLYIGRRANAGLPFNGQLYSLIVVGKAVTAGELSSTETYVNQKTGAY